jgi:hypothetical protein
VAGFGYRPAAFRGDLISKRAFLEAHAAAGNAALGRLIARSSGGATLHRDEVEDQPGPDPEMLSGKHWRAKADEMGWNAMTSLDELDESFRSNVERFIEALRDGGATVVISTTKRYIQRAWLMHNAWVVAHGGALPKDDPHGTGIVWDHGNKAATRQAAREMIGPGGFNMAFDASMRSMHFSGKAVDLTISDLPEEWTFMHGDKEVTVKLGTAKAPDNANLHRAADAFFGVKKLLGDRPHWSENGH